MYRKTEHQITSEVFECNKCDFYHTNERETLLHIINEHLNLRIINLPNNSKIVYFNNEQEAKIYSLYITSTNENFIKESAVEYENPGWYYFELDEYFYCNGYKLEYFLDSLNDEKHRINNLLELIKNETGIFKYGNFDLIERIIKHIKQQCELSNSDPIMWIGKNGKRISALEMVKMLEDNDETAISFLDDVAGSVIRKYRLKNV